MSGSRSSRRSARPSGAPSPGATDRAQAEPIAALAALLAVGIGLALFAVAGADAPPGPDRSLAEPALERASDQLLSDGVIEMVARIDPDAIGPEGYHANLTILAGGDRRSVGPVSPRGADRASRPVTVEVAPGDQRPGRLVVEVWQ